MKSLSSPLTIPTSSLINKQTNTDEKRRRHVMTLKVNILYLWVIRGNMSLFIYLRISCIHIRLRVLACTTKLLAAYRNHARDKGYGIVLERNKQLKTGKKTIYMCDRGGVYRDRKNIDLHPSFAETRHSWSLGKSQSQLSVISRYKLKSSRTVPGKDPFH